MPRIELLDQNTINKIAAGEVVERPASVVKELVENAIDAGSTAVTVEVKDGGLKLIRITDNGCGINKDQIRTAFLRHSTSKIREATDLITIASLGFRGEALASIAAVSMVELMTKVPEDMTGTRYVIEGGQEKSLEDIGCPTGTTFVIKDLFFNTPARLKFMKSASTELGYVADLMSRLAMGHPTVSFKFISNNKVKLQTAGKNNLKDCIYSVFGKDVTKNLISVEGDLKGIRIRGFIGKPHISRGNRTYENYYINGRYVKSKVVERAVEDAYKAKLMLHRYPFVAFHMTIDPKDVDVNVHPTKMEVRFMNEQFVYDFIFNAIDKGLNNRGLIPEMKIEQEKKETVIYKASSEPFEKGKTVANASVLESDQGYTTEPQVHIDLMQPSAHKAIKEALIKRTNESATEKEQPPNVSVNQHVNDLAALNEIDSPTQPSGQSANSLYTGNQVELEEANFIDPESIRSHKVIGQLFDTYWIVEMEEKYYIIDQHAAHEKVLYEKMLKKLETKVEYGQRLLQPVVINLSIQELSRYEAHQRLFVDLGFEVELFGEEAVIVRTVPFIFDKVFEVSQFTEILDGLEGAFSEEKYDILLHDIATMSCKAAVKGNDRLSKDEYVQLIEDLLKLDDPFHCPHGRPTIIAMTRYELEKKFKRIV